MKSWHGKVAIVTGGSSGLGRAIALALVRRGADVVIAARGAERLEAVAAELRREGTGVLALPADIRQQNDVDSLIATTIERYGRLDALVNNAGRSARGEALAVTPEEFQELIDLNFISLVRCTRAAMPYLRTTRGHLVNIGSLAGKTAGRYMGAYSASKFPVSAYSQQLRMELGPQGPHVLLVSPGPIAREESRSYTEEKLSGLPASARKPGGGVNVKLLRPEKVAERIVTACERRQPELVMPGRAKLVFAISQLSPSLGDWIIRKMTK